MEQRRVLSLLQFPDPQVVEADFRAGGADCPEFDARLLDVEIGAGSAEWPLALDLRHDIIALRFQQQCVPFAWLKPLRGRCERFALRLPIRLVVVLRDVPHGLSDHHRVQVTVLV